MVRFERELCEDINSYFYGLMHHAPKELKGNDNLVIYAPQFLIEGLIQYWRYYNGAMPFIMTPLDGHHRYNGMTLIPNFENSLVLAHPNWWIYGENGTTIFKVDLRTCISTSDGKIDKTTYVFPPFKTLLSLNSKFGEISN